MNNRCIVSIAAIALSVASAVLSCEATHSPPAALAVPPRHHKARKMRAVVYRPYIDCTRDLRDNARAYTTQGTLRPCLD